MQLTFFFLAQQKKYLYIDSKALSQEVQNPASR